MNQTIHFEEYLRNIHAKNYKGTDDDMIDAFENWLENLGVDEIMDYADVWAYQLINNSQK